MSLTIFVYYIIIHLYAPLYQYAISILTDGNNFENILFLSFDSIVLKRQIFSKSHQGVHRHNICNRIFIWYNIFLNWIYLLSINLLYKVAYRGVFGFHYVYTQLRKFSFSSFLNLKSLNHYNLQKLVTVISITFHVICIRLSLSLSLKSSRGHISRKPVWESLQNRYASYL